MQPVQVPIPAIKPAEQIEIILRLLSGKVLTRSSPVWARCLEWLVSPALKEAGNGLHHRLLDAVCKSFAVTEQEIYSGITGVQPVDVVVEKKASDEEELRALLPQGGWFQWYTEYTERTESPLSFHVFSSLVALGAAIGRRAYLDMGFYRLYPNYCAVLIGPTGRVRKTSAVNVARNIVDRCGLAPILADKPTPEALAMALKECGQQFIYAPEFSVFFGRQKYNEGLTTLVIRLLDCPDRFDIRTMGRGVETVENVALSMLGGSTLSLLSTGSAHEVTSSGFLNRLVLVVENDTSREFDVPEKGSAQLEQKLFEQATRLKSFIGEFSFTVEARVIYHDWYTGRKRFIRKMVDEITAEVLERSPDHLLRTAMLIHAVQCDGMIICGRCMEAAIKLMAYIERKVPQTVSAISQGSVQNDTEYLRETLIRLGGSSDHSKLLRRVSSKLNARSFKRTIETLVDSGQVREENRGALRFYVLLGPREE